MYNTEREKYNEIKNLAIFCIIISIVLLILEIISVSYLNKKNAELETKNSELSGSLNDYQNLCEEQEQLIDSLENELNQSFIDNKKTIKRELSYIEPLKYLDKKEYLKQYKKILSQYKNIYDDTERIEDIYSQKQIEIMWRCIETETYGADIDSKTNVASVILNRVEHEVFPTDPIEVITKPNQFAYGRTKISEDTKIALEYAFMVEDTTDGCIAFRSDSSPKTWGKWKYKFTDNVGHNFYYIEERSNDN